MAAGGRPVDVLLVDDDDDLAECIECTLEAAGYSIVRASDGQQGLNLLSLVTPRLVLLDMMMPRLDGFGVLRAMDRRNGVRVVAMSSFHEFLPAAAGLGAAATLPKPFEAHELERVVAKVLDGQTEPAGRPFSGAADLPGVGGAPGPDADELQRIERLHCLRIMGVQTDEALDALVRATAELMRTPIALVSLITEDRQLWKAMHGVTGELARARGTPRDMAFCTHALAARSPLVVQDAHNHPLFADNELVRRGVLNAYAGVPVEVAGVGALGTLCVLDTAARVFTSADLDLLALLAQRAAAEIEWRERDRLGDRPLGTFGYLSMLDERHGIYNAPAHASLVDAMLRRTLLEGGSAALVAFDRPAAGWPAAEHEADIELLLRAVRTLARPRDVPGRLDDRAICVVLPGADAGRARTFVRDVLAREAAARRAEGGPELPDPVGAWVESRGALGAKGPRLELRARLDEALARARPEPLPRAPRPRPASVPDWTI